MSNRPSHFLQLFSLQFKRSVAFLSFFLFSFSSYAQKEANIWYFGRNAGLDFSNGEPIPLIKGNFTGPEGCAVISDKNGDLLFYSNGENVWNRNHKVMSNGSNLAGDAGATQAALIVPYPSMNSRYFLFTVSSISQTSASNVQLPALSYSVVDMDLNEGLGDVVESQKNILLADSTTEKVTAVPHANGTDYWLISHKMGSDNFYVFLVSKEGVSNPKVQRIGTKHTVQFGKQYNANNEAQGYLKASPDGKMIASAVTSLRSRPFEVFDFDNRYGVLSNCRKLGDLALQYGVSFSPDNSKLYVSGFDSLQFYSNGQGMGRGPIFQYDLNAGNVQSIISSRVDVFIESSSAKLRKSNTALPAIQIGPNGRIYIAGNVSVEDMEAKAEGHTLFVISQPNQKGAASKLTSAYFDFGDGRHRLGLPNFIESYFNGLTPEDNPNISCTSVLAFHLYPNPVSNYLTIDLLEHCVYNNNIEVSLFNSIGKEIRTFFLNGDKNLLLDFNRYTRGTYLLVFQLKGTAETGPGKRIVKKIIKI